MKTVYKLFHATVLTLCSAIMLSSCDSFLDTKPYDFTAPETFYSNESECTAALAGVYYKMCIRDRLCITPLFFSIF